MNARQAREFEMLYCKARMAGLEAGRSKVPRPMVVAQHENMADDASPVEKQWFVPSGVCGFAWVNIRPGNCPFANWMKKNNHGSHSSYEGGVIHWVSDFGQSMEQKIAYAHAFAHVISEAGIKVYTGDRMD